MQMRQVQLSHAVYPESDAPPGSGDSYSQVERNGQRGLLPPQQQVSKAKCLVAASRLL